jgi:hypothetical protein
LRANGSRECAPDDRLREAIHPATQRKNGLLRRFAPLRKHFVFVAGNDDDHQTHLRLLADRCARVVRKSSPERAWGMPGARCTRSRAWCVVNTRVSHHGYTGSPGIPARNGFNGFLRALLGDRAFLSPSSADHSADLTPASGRQDHTTSPSAIRRSSAQKMRCDALRPPHPAPNVRDDRETPL